MAGIGVALVGTLYLARDQRDTQTLANFQLKYRQLEDQLDDVRKTLERAENTLTEKNAELAKRREQLDELKRKHRGRAPNPSGKSGARKGGARALP